MTDMSTNLDRYSAKKTPVFRKTRLGVKLMVTKYPWTVQMIPQPKPKKAAPYIAGLSAVG
ncbi:hypothetical protein RvY_03539 [Ramazzottius varieornatus]|uniref:Uncharacterized protein n=1 Tax=Ramazzottius varieornatus TaxID=947166 RepID=A0A1D1UXS6_RAMVA|nr:hypothetical protein RvY_03539 [Ramazzottius varieornatus]